MSNFTNLINGEKPVLIDFFADWCGPCKMMAPVLTGVKATLGDDVVILKIDVDKNKSLAAKYQIKGVPTFMIFKEGKLLWRQSGMLQKQELIDIINQFK